jgi:hypothetical protein
MPSPTNNGGGVAHAWIRNNILGLVAIFIALSGTAVAANVASDGGNATAAKAKKGPRGPRGPAGPAGAPGAPGLTGAAGSAVAYAHVLANGTLDAANSKNISGIEYNAPTFYTCLRTSVPVKNAVATAGGSGASGEVRVVTGDPFTSCNSTAVGAQFQFITSTGAGVDAARDFYVAFN